MAKRTNNTPVKSTSTDDKKELEELFEKRNRTEPGSKEEEDAAKKILESVFPDTNAG
jgi:hypothetical protein